MGLYATDPGADQPRPTVDIDISVQVNSYSEMNLLQSRLAKHGIFPDPYSKVIYRYHDEGILLDFIPTAETALGPTNPWLKVGFEESESVVVGKVLIRKLPVSLFLATKWEAHKDRGGDPRVSHDFEDIVYVLDANSEVVSSTRKATPELQLFLGKMSSEILECHLNPMFAPQRRDLIKSTVLELA